MSSSAQDDKGQLYGQAEEEEVEVEYITEAFDIVDPNYRQFAKIFEAFKVGRIF